MNLANSNNYIYTGPLWIGSENELVTVVYDTGSDTLLLETDMCSQCIEPVFHTQASTTYEEATIETTWKLYGSAQISGKFATDSVAMDEDNNPPMTLSSFKFFAAQTQSGISEEFDGILGMSRQMYTEEYNSDPILLEGLYNASLISKE